MQSLVSAAKSFSLGSHQRITANRLPSQQNIENHLKSVAQMVASVTKDEATIAAAWLHDLVEDTAVTIGDIERQFGSDVARLVSEVTHVSRSSDGDRAARFLVDKKHFEATSPEAMTIKVADLIDTGRDLQKSKHPEFADYAREAAELAELLQAADAQLLRRLRRDLEKYALSSTMQGGTAAPKLTPLAFPISALRVFGSAFSAQDIAEPIAHGEAAGSRQVVKAGDSLTDVIEVLTRHDHCFVSCDGKIAAVITRADIQKPAVRMWLFGIITVAEIEFTEMVRQKWPDGSWAELISQGRLEKAKQLLQERERRKEKCELVDCLQLGDKFDILMSDPAQLAAFSIPTPSVGKRMSKQIESLRNTLAHAQDFVDEDWPQIVRLARRIEMLVRQL
jgi:hypothetical protein